MIPVLVFDIETIPDVAGLRRLHAVDPAVPDAEVAAMAFQLRRQAVGHDFLPLHLHRVIAISCALSDGETFRVWSISETALAGAASEGEIIQRFFDGIEKYTPQLVSWNGAGFDLPVLHYRGLIHGVRAPRYWDTGDDDREFRYNNYISRYHMRHCDVMDLLSLYQSRAVAPLDEIAQLLGLPGKLGMDGSQVWNAYQAGRLADIVNYCETDVVNTYLVFLRFQAMRGAANAEQYQAQSALVRSTLERLGEPHWQEFLSRWTVS
ncbi:MAG TPA: 3'-5' exonuclease [Burkholderiales bacterium]|nr:3'-5' exonuclease [Burkholderiales bacterium]